MWSFSVEYLDDFGQIIKSVIVTATNPFGAQVVAGYNAPADYAEVQVTRL